MGTVVFKGVAVSGGKDNKMNSRLRFQKQKQMERWLRETGKMPSLKPVDKRLINEYAVETFRRKPYGGSYAAS